ncbi:MAG TPA: metal-transporting ATPase [Saprospiraceae bacterium]|nr:metal-transporting ATPase [Saprospiraceae bacterium]
MENYYSLEENPGISLKNIKISPNSYVVLDAPDVVESLLSIKTDKVAKVTLKLPNIHCASCLWLLENLYKFQEGIISSRVNFMKKEAVISFDPNIMSLKQVAQLLAAVGYPPELNLGTINAEETGMSPASKKMLYRLGVAGFAFGNIMLMSFPDYLHIDEHASDVALRAFPYMNFVLAVPMVFYSGWDYLDSAWKGIKSRHLNMDVPISLGFLALFFRSAYEVFAGVGTGYFDSLAGLIFFLLIGKWFQDRTYRKIAFDRDYRSYFPIWANKMVDGEEVPTALNQLTKDDIILVRNGEMVPSDGQLIEGKGLIDYSFVTGESEPVKVDKGEKVYAGGYQQGPAIQIALLTDVSQSYLTNLWNNDAFVKEKERPASALSDVVGRRFTYVILMIAFLTLFYWLPRDWSLAIYAFTSVLIVACPCAISLSIPFTLGNVLSVLGRNRIYLKNTMVIEDLAEINHIVFDKTGTLTQKGLHFSERKRLTPYQKRMVKTLVLQSNHPISRLLQQEMDVTPFGRITDYQEVLGYGVKGIVDGHQVEVVSGAFEGEQTGTQIRIDGQVVGSFLTIDKLRPKVKELFADLRQKYKLSLISGDNDSAKGLMSELFAKAGSMYYEQKPEDKLNFIEELKRQGDKVMMVGDGLNDAGALKMADVGVVLTEEGNNFTPASDLILSVNKLPKLADILTLSQKSIKVIYKAYLFALIYNIIGLSFAVRGLLSPVIAAILMPLSSITVVLIGVILSTLLLKKMDFSQNNDTNHQTRV